MTMAMAMASAVVVTNAAVRLLLLVMAVVAVVVAVVGHVIASGSGDISVRQLVSEHALKFSRRRRRSCSCPLRSSRTALWLLLLFPVTRETSSDISISIY